MKKHFFKSILSCISLLVITISINYFIDAYGVFGHSLDKQVLEPNKNYVKTKYILENSKNYDSFIFGSSKVGVYSVNKLDNGKYFNMTYSQGLPSEWLETINIFLENKIEIKNLIIGIDSFSFTVDPNSHLNQPMRMPYSLLTNQKNIFMNYLFVNPFNIYNTKTFISRFVSKKYYNFFEKEKIRDNFSDLQVEKNTITHVNDSKFLTPIAFNEVDRLEETINELKEIKKICEENEIKVYFLINPVHSITYDNSNQEGLKKLKNELSEFTDYWDFSIQDKFSKDNYYWYETSHFRTNLADLILKIIFKNKYNKEIELEGFTSEFGVYKHKKSK
ncbi:MAG: hypothetical protein ACRC0G_03360 [Fusobacteriaceae bacterium]